MQNRVKIKIIAEKCLFFNIFSKKYYFYTTKNSKKINKNSKAETKTCDIMRV